MERQKLHLLTGSHIYLHFDWPIFKMLAVWFQMCISLLSRQTLVSIIIIFFMARKWNGICHRMNVTNLATVLRTLDDCERQCVSLCAFHLLHTQNKYFSQMWHLWPRMTPDRVYHRCHPVDKFYRVFSWLRRFQGNKWLRSLPFIQDS